MLAVDIDLDLIVNNHFHQVLGQGTRKKRRNKWFWEKKLFVLKQKEIVSLR